MNTIFSFFLHAFQMNIKESISMYDNTLNRRILILNVKIKGFYPNLLFIFTIFFKFAADMADDIFVRDR